MTEKLFMDHTYAVGPELEVLDPQVQDLGDADVYSGAVWRCPRCGRFLKKRRYANGIELERDGDGYMISVSGKYVRICPGCGALVDCQDGGPTTPVYALYGTGSCPKCRIELQEVAPYFLKCPSCGTLYYRKEK